MRKTVTLFFTVFSIISYAQIAQNPSIFKPDSVVYYADSIEKERQMIMINKYDGDSIEVAAYWYNNDTINYANKNVYYMDENLPELSFEPLFSGGRNGNSSGYSYEYTSTIGDTLSVSYNYDLSLKIWVKASKTRHNISDKGIDTLATTYTWNKSAKDWEMNNLSKQTFIAGEVDSLEVLMVAPNLTDTINHDVFSYEYDLNKNKTRIKQTTPGAKYLSIDSITYTESGLIDFIYYGNNYDCVNSGLTDCDNQILYDYANQYFYDAKGRLDKIYFWNKQGIADWSFDGSYQYYYSNQTSSINEEYAENLINFYPNPCKTTLTIESYSGEFEIYNSMGQLVISKQIENGGLINTSSLQNGIYILKFGDVFSKLIIR